MMMMMMMMMMMTYQRADKSSADKGESAKEQRIETSERAG